jgi:aminopeptidase N
LGRPNFLLGLSNFFDQFKYEIALLSDFQDIVEDTVNETLDWFFFPWFDNDYLPKYRFTRCHFDDYEWLLTVIIEDQNEEQNSYPYSQQVTLRVYDADDTIIFDDYVWINSTTTFNISLAAVPERVRLVYGNDVIVQLDDETITYIEARVGEEIDRIPGYDIQFFLIFCILPLVYLIYKFSIKLRNKFKI